MYCPECRVKKVKATPYEQKQIEDLLLCYGMPYINELSVKFGFEPFPDERPLIPTGRPGVSPRQPEEINYKNTLVQVLAVYNGGYMN